MTNPSQTSRRRRTRPTRSLPGMVGRSTAFRALERAVDALLDSPPALILLRGETGSGKSLLARAIHARIQPRGSPFLVLPCGGLAGGIIEREIFGHQADAAGAGGLLALAVSGTLLIEDADRLPARVLTRLRNRLRSPGLSVPKVIGTTRRSRIEPPQSADLHGLAAPWLEGCTVELPPLRRRMDDLELLAEHFLLEWGRAREQSAPEAVPEALEALHSHPWPGNVRELRQVIEAAATNAPGRVIRTEHLRVRVRDSRPLPDDRDIAPEMIRIPSNGKSWEAIEAEAVQATLRITSWNRSQAARILGMSRPTLARKIRKYRLEPPAHHR